MNQPPEDQTNRFKGDVFRNGTERSCSERGPDGARGGGSWGGSKRNEG